MAFSVVPANKASWADMQAVFGDRGEAAKCQCQWFRIPASEWRSVPAAERTERHAAQTNCGRPRARRTSGLIAYTDDVPAAWCALAPRPEYPHLRTSRVVWTGRAAEDPDDDSVWSLTCFVTRVGYRRRGLMGVLAAAAVDFARERGARAIEAYPLIPDPGQELSWGELYVGHRDTLADAGVAEVARPTKRRVVMRIDFG